MTIATAENCIASYRDGSGTYDIYRRGDRMTTVICKGTELEESFDHLLVRADIFDMLDERADFALTERFYSSPDFGTDGMCWIDDEAFDMIYQGATR